MSKNVTNFITPRVVCTSITNRVLSWFDRFMAYYYCMSKKVKKNSYLHEFCAQLSQIVLLADLTVLLLIRTVWGKMSKNSYLRGFSAQVSQIVFLGDLTVLRIFTTVWEKNWTKLISPLVLCTSLPNRVFSWFDRFTSYYNCMKENVTKLISARVLCTSVTNRVHCWFDHFTA